MTTSSSSTSRSRARWRLTAATSFELPIISRRSSAKTCARACEPVTHRHASSHKHRGSQEAHRQQLHFFLRMTWYDMVHHGTWAPSITRTKGQDCSQRIQVDRVVCFHAATETTATQLLPWSFSCSEKLFVSSPSLQPLQSGIRTASFFTRKPLDKNFLVGLPCARR